MKGLIEGSVAPEAPVAPVIIYFGDKDTTKDPTMGKLYQQQKCAMGANVTRVQLPGEQNHFTTPPVAEPLSSSGSRTASRASRWRMAAPRSDSDGPL